MPRAVAIEPTPLEYAICPVKAGEIMAGRVLAAAVFVLDDWQGAYARDVVKALRQRRAEMPVVVIACDDGAGPWYAENGVTVLAKEAGAEAVVEAIG